jgi:hypothetical protein
MGNESVEGKVNGHGAPAESKAIVSAPPTAVASAVASFSDETVEQKLAKAERQIAFRKGILKLIAANIDPSDVALFGEEGKENIHLTKQACKQILSWAGITVQPDNAIVEKRYDGVEGPYIDFEVWATWFTPDGRYYRTMGNRSTYDDFFAKRTKWTCAECGAEIKWEDRKAICVSENKRVTAEKTTYYLPLSEVDIPAVKQAAITNLWNHIVDDAGLKPSLKELQAVGFRIAQAGSRVDFASSDKKAPRSTPQQSSQKPQNSSPNKGAAATPSNTAAAPAPLSGVPKAQIPADKELPIGKGIISEVREKTTKPKDGKGGGKPFLEVVQNGHFLFCFKNSEIETMEGPERVFELIKGAKGQFCDFVVETKQGERPLHSIVGATQIGRNAWDATTGEPVPPPYEAVDEDIPF